MQHPCQAVFPKSLRGQLPSVPPRCPQYVRGRRHTLHSLDVARGEAVFARAKLAGNRDAAVCFAHLRELGGSELAQVDLNALARAATRRGKTGRTRHHHALLMEQSVEQTLRRKNRVEQLMVLDSGGEETGAVPVLRIVVFT